MKKNRIYAIIIITILTRIFCIFFINKTPCMEHEYYLQGEHILHGDAEILYLSSFYSLIIYTLTTLFNNLFLASAIIFILSSALISINLYLLGKLFFDEKTGIICASFAIFLPNLTVTVAGYSHSVILGSALELSSIYLTLLYFKTNFFSFLSITTYYNFNYFYPTRNNYNCNPIFHFHNSL